MILRVPLVRPRALDEVRLKERGLQAAVAAVQIAKDDQLDGRARPHHVDVAIEKLRASRYLLDIGDAVQAMRAGRTHSLPLQDRLLDELVVPLDLRLALDRVW